ncbi:Alpha-L-arabinofuranosidase [Paenibacillus algorifonticola]|uniref:non-reducing end alpha-L-arabinofuranosidase n=1 Tax=Paenibacillus algorifonticola TaxID=684063 RepID=A0A1I2GHT6_9BACL|nr:LamG-like jellyroll fold domain-containing protein [Paenibacillus algorifonticola]SFF17414.1 Alpha-L-arabinofuranosidase [Paenibacillus algorifonticola]
MVFLRKKLLRDVIASTMVLMLCFSVVSPVFANDEHTMNTSAEAAVTEADATETTDTAAEEMATEEAAIDETAVAESTGAVPDGLLLHYDFNETEGVTVKDSSLNGNDGLLSGGAAWTADGKINGAVDFNGTDAYVKLPDGLLAATHDMTIATWVKADSLGAWARVFDFGTSTTNWMFLTLKNHLGVAHFAALPQGNGENTLTGPAFPASSSWQHVAVVISGNTYTMFINGIQVATVSNMQNDPSELGFTTNNYIGKSQFAADPYFDGKIDDFRIYDRALSASELVSLVGEALSDTEIIAYDKNWLELGDTTQQTKDLALPSAGPGGTVISWASSDPATVSTEGKVTRPEAGQGDKTVILTATIAKGAEQDTKSFTIVVWELDSASYTLNINGREAAHEVSPTLYGIFYEDINYAADGGLYGELVQNRSFEFGTSLFAWSKAAYGGAAGELTTATDEPLNASNPRFARLTITNAGSEAGAAVGLANAGYSGIAVASGETYNFSVYARSASPLTKPLVAQLRGQDDTVYGSCEVTGLAADWQKVGCAIQTNAASASAKLVVIGTEQAVIDLDMVSLFPEKTWQNRTNGLRYDLAEMLDDLNPGFLRFPGGCIVEGGSLENRYRWKNTIGDVAERQIQRNQWAANYYQSFGLGFQEYFQLSEDIGAEPLPIIFIGQVSCHGNPPKVPMNELDPYIQDALDLIEYANGPVDSTWGAVRAANGHPEPFNMKYLGVGNELWGQDYLDRYEVFYDAIKAKYPDIQLVLSAGAFPEDSMFHYAYDWLGSNGNKADLVDEHMYQSPQWFYNNVNRYDHYSRSGPKVFVGEYAAHGTGKKNNMESALAEAAFMTGLERNSDVVAMSSFAPLFARQGNTQWTTDLIWFDNSRAYGTPNYYVQQLFSRHVGQQLMPSQLHKNKSYSSSTVQGSIALGSWNTAVEYDDVTVTANDGTILLQNDFSDPSTLSQWSSFKGAWSIDGGVLKQTSTSTTDARLLLKEGQQWSNYTLQLKAKKAAGSEGFLIGFGAKDTDNYYWWNLGGWTNTLTVIEQAVGGTKSNISNSLNSGVEANRWYDIKIELQGSLIRCYLDGVLVHEVDRDPGPLYSVTTKDDKTGDLIVKVVNIGGSEQTSIVNVDADYIDGSATVLELKAASAAAENSFATPENIVPEVKEAAGLGQSFTYDFPAYSVTVLRLRTVPGAVITAIEPVEVRAAVGAVPLLPASVSVSNSDGSEQNVNVQWGKIDEEQMSKTGLFKVKGEVAGTYLTAEATVIVAEEDEGPTPTPTPQPSPTPTPEPTASATPSPSATPQPTTSATPTPSATPNPTSSPSGGSTSSQPTASPVGTGGGKQLVEVDEKTVKAALESAIDGKIKLKINSDAKANGWQVTIPLSRIMEYGSSEKAEWLEIDTGFAIVTVSLKWLENNTGAAPKSLTLSISKADISKLPAETQQQLIGAVVYDFQLEVDGVKVSDFDGRDDIAVAIPYTLQFGENPNQVIICYITDSGALEAVKNSKYDPLSGNVVFKPKHFSKYAAVYRKVGFADVTKAWQQEPINALAARDIISGTGGGQFKPEAAVTRAEFIAMLMNGLDLTEANALTPLSDVQQGAWYYDAIATSYKLGIVKGKSDGSFGVHDKITRQDMAVMAYQAAKYAEHKLAGEAAAPFSDQNAISVYAKKGVAAMQAARIVSGMGQNEFAPQAQATRAQAAVMIYKLLSLQVE